MYKLSNIEVLYEDNHVIAVVKPAGVPTFADGGGEFGMAQAVKDYLKIKYAKPGNVFLGLVHRLDKPVQGIILFGKTSKGTSRLSEQFRQHSVQKTYHAIVLGKPKESRGQIKEKINKISFFTESFVAKSDEELLREIRQATQTRTAELSWIIEKSNGQNTLLKIFPKTGRFHQIRVQMANMGYPILGDRKYASDFAVSRMHWSDGESIALAATGIGFKAVTADKRVDLSIPLPEVWRRYLEAR